MHGGVHDSVVVWCGVHGGLVVCSGVHGGVVVWCVVVCMMV